MCGNPWCFFHGLGVLAQIGGLLWFVVWLFAAFDFGVGAWGGVAWGAACGWVYVVMVAVV